LKVVAYLILFFYGGVVDAPFVEAKSLQVSPPAYYWRIKTPGSLAQLPVPVKVTNDSFKSRSYTVRFKTAAEIGAKDEPGFKTLSRKDWLSTSAVEFTLEPGKSGGPKVFALIPDQPENYGKKWLVYLQIKEKPPRNDQFALACYPKIYLEVPWKKKK